MNRLTAQLILVALVAHAYVAECLHTGYVPIHLDQSTPKTVLFGIADDSRTYTVTLAVALY
jgi:hypothetical protein